MGITDTTVTTRTIKCDGPECTKTLTFDKAEAELVNNAPENLWLKPARVVSTNDARTLLYCSDVCEVNGVKAGQHNPIEKPKVHTDANPAAVAAAVQAAATARNAEAALRSGQGNIKVVDR